MIYGNVEGLENVPVRVHDACFTSEVLGSLKCDCKQQLDMALEYIRDNELGVVIYLEQEGRGIGLANKIAAYKVQESGADTVDANRKLGLPDDIREYSAVRNIVDDLNIKSVALMTNNPRKINELEKEGVNVTSRIPCVTKANLFSEKYLEARKDSWFGGGNLPDGRCFLGGDEDEEDVKCPYEKKMKDVRCPFGVRCYFSDRHENNAKESKTLLEWRRSEGSEEFNAMEDWLQKKLRESTYLLPRSTKYLEMVGNDLLCVSKAKKRKITAINRNNKDDDENENENEEKTVKKNAIDFNKKLVLAPLTTVGHAPFRRMCVKFGADVTISEMAMASNLLAGDRREWALVRRHACESSATNKFGVQICGGYPDLVSRCVVRLFCFVFRVVCLRVYYN